MSYHIFPLTSFRHRPVFDAATDTYDALHERSPFAVTAICMVAARVRDGGGQCCKPLESMMQTEGFVLATTPSEVHLKCLQKVRGISSATLFAPVSHCEAVQAMSKLKVISL